MHPVRRQLIASGAIRASVASEGPASTHRAIAQSQAIEARKHELAGTKARVAITVLRRRVGA